MHPNLLFIPTLLGAILFCWAGIKVYSTAHSPLTKAVLFALAVALAVPALIFVTYYGHVLDRATWFYSFRAAPFTELTASGIGFGTGLIFAWLKQLSAARNSAVIRLSGPSLLIGCGGLLMVPYAKPIIAPLEVPLQTRTSNGVTLQSTPATCGPSSAVTILRFYGIPATERELARECFSYRGGTENWYVARALQRRGLETSYIVSEPQSDTIPMPSIAGVQLGGPGVGGHFITVLGRVDSRRDSKYLVGDPLVGLLNLTPEEIHKKYYFTGFFLKVTGGSKQVHLPMLISL